MGWACEARSRVLSRRPTQVVLNGADLASSTLIQILRPNLKSLFVVEDFSRKADFSAWAFDYYDRKSVQRTATAAPSGCPRYDDQV